MITLETTVDEKLIYPVNKPYELEDILFFDIETTGLSASTSYLYLIGCMFYKNNTWNIVQWFADDMNSEALLIESFYQKLKSYKRLIHFNGSGFDIPFIIKKCQQHNLVNPFEQIESYDIYRKLNPYKKKLPLTNLKLKTIEAFVHFTRLDLFSGEELIQIYANYLGKVQYERLQEKIQRQLNTNKTNPVVSPLFNQTNKSQNPTSNELLNQILLHNLEDIKGLIKVSDILFYVDLFESFTEDSLQNTYKHEFKIITLTKTIDQSSVLVEMSLPYTLPTSVIWSLSLESLIKNETDLIHFVSGLTFKLEVFMNRLRLTIPLFHGELKVFYENYRDYYYLIKEDYAIHQSIAQYVDKEYRVKAKPATCYSKKTGNFLPQPVVMFLPALKLTYSDKMYYFEESNLVNGNERTKEYIDSVIHFILTNKNTELFTN